METTDSNVDDFIQKNDQAIQRSCILALETFYAKYFFENGLSALSDVLSMQEPAFKNALFSISQKYLESQIDLSKADQEALNSKDEIQIIKTALDSAHWQYHHKLYPTEETSREDALFAARLKKGFEEIHLREYRKRETKQRWLTALSGAVIALAYGCLILLLAWSFNQVWNMSYWNSLAALVDGPLIALFVSLQVDTYRGKWKKKYTYKSILFGYFLFSLLGALIILFRSNTGIDQFFIPFPEAFGNLFLVLNEIDQYIVLLALIVAGMVWFYNTIILPAALDVTGNGPTDAKKLSPGCLIEFWEKVQYWFYGFAIALFGIDILFDSIHSVPWVLFGGDQWLASMVNRYPLQISLSVSILIGFLVGFIASDLRDLD